MLKVAEPSTVHTFSTRRKELKLLEFIEYVPRNAQRAAEKPHAAALLRAM
jgi:hypothetical protein